MIGYGAKNKIVTAFKTLPACDIINLTSLMGSIYVESL